MSSRKRKRLSVWDVLGRLGHAVRAGHAGDDHDEIIQHIFERTSRLTLHSDDGEPMSGDDFLASVFELLGTSTESPGVGTPEWERLRTVALRRVVARLSREGLLDSIAVGSVTDARDMDSDCETNSDSPATKGEGSDATDGDETSSAKGGEQVGEVETPATDGGSIDPRIGVQVFRSYIRRDRRNPDGWFRGVERDTPYTVLVQWAKETCPGVAAESLAELMDRLRAVRWWDVDGVIGDDGDCTDDCIQVIGIFLDEAQRSGRIECLRRPGTRDTTEVLDAMARLREDGGE